MEMEQRGEQSISFSRVSIAEKTTSVVTNREKVVNSSETERKERMDIFSYSILLIDAYWQWIQQRCLYPKPILKREKFDRLYEKIAYFVQIDIRKSMVVHGKYGIIILL